MSDFDLDIVTELEGLFEAGSVETLVWSGDEDDSNHYPVKVIHRPSGKEAVCSEYRSQIQNKAMALATIVAIVPIGGDVR